MHLQYGGVPLEMETTDMVGRRKYTDGELPDHANL